MQQVVDVTAMYHAILSRLSINIRSLLDNMRVNKRPNGGDTVMWADVVAICRDQ